MHCRGMRISTLTCRSMEPLKTSPRLFDNWRKAWLPPRVRLLTLTAAALFPQEFNELVAQTDSKGETLSLTTLRLVEECCVHCRRGTCRSPATSMEAGPLCGIAAARFPRLASFRPPRRAGESIYCIQHEGRQVIVHFLTKGERLLPTALASMLAK